MTLCVPVSSLSMCPGVWLCVQGLLALCPSQLHSLLPEHWGPSSHLARTRKDTETEADIEAETDILGRGHREPSRLERW